MNLRLHMHLFMSLIYFFKPQLSKNFFLIYIYMIFYGYDFSVHILCNKDLFIRKKVILDVNRNFNPK